MELLDEDPALKERLLNALLAERNDKNGVAGNGVREETSLFAEQTP